MNITNVIVPNRTRVAEVDPASGTFDYTAFISLVSETPGATIYYTTDGSDPDNTDTLYTGQFALASSATIKALATRSDKRDSAITSGSLTINAPPSRHDISSGTYIEAAGAQTFDGCIRRPDVQATNGLYVLGLDDDEDGDDEYFDIDITCQQTGTYHLWLRCRASMYSRVQVRLDAGAWTSITVSSHKDYFKGWGWHWREVGLTYSLTVSTNYTFRIRRRVGSNACAPGVDRLFFTTSGAAEPPELELIHPNGGERWPLDTNQDITWQSGGDISNVKIEFSDDDGETWETVVASTADDGSYTWTSVPSSAAAGCRVRISNPNDSKIFDRSDGAFCIDSDTNPFSTSILMSTKLNQGVGKEPWDQGDRETYLAELEAKGDLQKEAAFWATFNLGSSGDHDPDTEAINAFRTGNNNVTKLITYNNLFSVHERSGEAMMGDLSNAAYDDYFLYDTSSNLVENPVNGRDCFDFRNTDFLDYLVSRIKSYMDAGINGFPFDSFNILRKRGYENGYWHETYSGGVYSDDIEIENPRTSDTYTADDWIADMRYAVSYVRRAVDEYYNDEDVIFTINGLRPEHIEEYGDLLDAFFKEGYAGPSSTKASLPDWWFARNMWELDVNSLILAEALAKYSILGHGKVTGTPWSQSDNSASLYYAASMLMGIQGPDTKAYLRARGYTIGNWAGWANLRLARFVPEGRYCKTGDDVYRREFQHALVYVNPTKTNQSGISLGDDYYYMQSDGTWSASTIDTLSLNAGRGTILVLDTTWGD